MLSGAGRRSTVHKTARASPGKIGRARALASRQYGTGLNNARLRGRLHVRFQRMIEIQNLFYAIHARSPMEMRTQNRTRTLKQFSMVQRQNVSTNTNIGYSRECSLARFLICTCDRLGRLLSSIARAQTTPMIPRRPSRRQTASRTTGP
jgi:hypothetical protein